MFPCVPGAKKPLTANGFHDATTDLAQIDAWWEAHPTANIAFCPQDVGLGIVDIDGEAGEASWAEVQAEYGEAPSTYVVDTPRGGRHLYFFGELPQSQSKLGPHIDTRGRGSYALVPPSRLDGWPEPYRVGEGRTPAAVPTWVATALGKARERAKASREELDQPASLARATSLLTAYAQRGHVAIEGEMGDARTFAVACEVMNLGVSEDMALDLIDTLWNPHCQPPWERDELAVKVANAASYAQNEPGAWATPPAEEVFGPILDKLGIKAEPQAGRSRFYPYDEDEQNELRDPTWIFPHLLPDDSTVMLYGESGTYKSFLALDMALTVASGIEGFGSAARQQADVVFIAGEGPRSIAKQRRPAWRLARGVEGPIPFHIIDTMPLMARPDEVGQVIEEIKRKGLKPKLIVVDTLARAMAGMNENDAKDAGLFIEAIEALKRSFGCTILIVHHAGKESGRGARGSSALQAGFDAAFEVKADKKVKNNPALALWCRKMKDADERETPWCFEGKEIGPSLVFFPISAEAHRAMTASQDALSAKLIAAALVELGARGEENGVSTSVLAAHLTTEREGQDAEDRQEMVEKTARALKARAVNGLEAYCDGKGHGIRWSLPSG